MVTIGWVLNALALTGQASVHSGTNHVEFVIDGLHIQGITQSYAMRGPPPLESHPPVSPKGQTALSPTLRSGGPRRLG